MAVSPDGELVFAGISDVTSDDDNGSVAAFRREPVSGALTLVDLAREGGYGVAGLGDGARAAISPDGAHLYAASASGSSLTVLGTGIVPPVPEIATATIPTPKDKRAP